VDIDHAGPDRFSYADAKSKGRDEVKKGGPNDSLPRREHTSGNDSGDGIGGIMKAVQEVEHQRREDEPGNEQECG